MTNTAKLISHTQFSTGDLAAKGLMTLQDMVCYCARVSNPSNQMNNETNERLIRYLIDNKHWSPFEMVSLCIEVKTTRDIARQMLRHRSFSFQEFSQRYSEVDDGIQEWRECRMQDFDNRQNSLDTSDTETSDWWVEAQSKVDYLSWRTYKEALANGIAKEVARALLPEGLTTSTLYVNGTLRSWMHYIEVRTDPTTQKEHRQLAVSCANEIGKVFPLIGDFVQWDIVTPYKQIHEEDTK